MSVEIDTNGVSLSAISQVKEAVACPVTADSLFLHFEARQDMHVNLRLNEFWGDLCILSKQAIP